VDTETPDACHATPVAAANQPQTPDGTFHAFLDQTPPKNRNRDEHECIETVTCRFKHNQAAIFTDPQLSFDTSKHRN
jgi:hypothetical protein